MPVGNQDHDGVSETPAVGLGRLRNPLGTECRTITSRTAPPDAGRHAPGRGGPFPEFSALKPHQQPARAQLRPKGTARPTLDGASLDELLVKIKDQLRTLGAAN